jgi:hypothetical protein
MNITGLKSHIKRDSKIEVIVAQFVKLKRTGHEFVGLCPFHAERTPSFTVDPIKKIFKCFGCGQGGDVIEFVMLHEKLGFMDAINRIAQLENIAYTFEPTEYKNSKGFTQKSSHRNIKAVERSVVEQTMREYQHNPFFWHVVALCGGDQRRALTQVLKYKVGTATGLKTVFWQIDQFMRPRTASVIAYGGDGHRKKDVDVKRVFTQRNGYTSCLYGEHLLFEVDQGKDLVCIVESEKTALIADLYYPTFAGKKAFWLASSGADGLTDEKIEALRGHRVCLIPDFSYVSRAKWGLLPMRKKLNDKGVRVVAADGEEDAEYVSAAQRLLRIGCKVEYYEAGKGREDNQDLADVLEAMPVPPRPQVVPAFTELRLQEKPFE